MRSLPTPAVRRTAFAGIKPLAFFAALVFACILFGAIPWLSVPTLGQALWASGFAQSYANAGGFAIYATDFGLPTPAPISFGLPATFVQGLLIHLFGIAAIDAYTGTVVLYLALALYGAMAMARLLGASYFPAVAIGLLWLALPVAWEHVGYSMLALGFALLPLYLYASSRVLAAHGRTDSAVAAGWFGAACIVAVFMDGYTFMMFVAASAILWLETFWSERSTHARSLKIALPIMVAGFLLAYFLYTSFIGKSQYRTFPLEFFRGWGVDVTMLLVPTRGIHWLWDLLGMSSARNDHIFWGDAAVWMTTFLVPLIASGVCGYAVSRKHKRAAALLVMSLIGLYLSLGPSLKVNSTKEVAGISQADRGPLMPEQYAWVATGSGWLSTNLPGFRDMRAAYRWIGLGALGLWALTALLLIRLHDQRPALAYAVTLLLIATFLPHLQRTVRDAMANREKAHSIVNALGQDLRDVAGDHGTLFFAPHGNDFLVNYLAATSGFRSHNIGGDKNVEIAQVAWSQTMRDLSANNLSTPQFRRDLRLVLLAGSVEAVVMPYFDTLRAALQWPPSHASVVAQRERHLPVAQAIAASPCFQARQFPMFAAISLSDLGRRQQERLLADSGDADPAAEIAEVCRLAE